MSKMMSNIILIFGLTLLGRSIFAILASNTSVSENHQLEQIQGEIKDLRDQIAILDNKIASKKSTTNEQIRHLDLQAAGYVPIDELEIVTDVLASL